MTAVLPRHEAGAPTRTPDGARGIRAHLDATFALDGARLTHDVSASTALELRGPFRRGNEPARFFVRNVTTGIFGGDAYRVSAMAGAGTTVWLSASSATKVHEMPDTGATLSTELEVLSGATLLWGPHPTILQGGSRLSSYARWRVHTGGALVAAEVLSLGRRASGEGIAFESYASSQVIEDAGARPLVEERYELRPGPAIEDSLAGFGTIVSVYALGAVAAPDDATVALVEGCAGYAGVGELPNGAGWVVRALVSSLNDGTVLAESLMRAILNARPA
nr:J204 [uncultured bacterium]